jgi:hypothetical protein
MDEYPTPPAVGIERGKVKGLYRLSKDYAAKHAEI